MPAGGPVLTADGDGARDFGRDGAAALALLAFGALLPWALRAALGMSHPAGSDPDLWGLYALNVPLGTPCAVPPAFPTLVYLIHAVTGLLPVPAAALAAWIGASLVAPLAFALARALGAGRIPALAVGALALTTPHAATLTVQAQPDTWVMVLLLTAALAAVAAHRRPGAPGSLALVVVAGCAPLWREHGLVVALVLLALAPLLRGAPRWRGLRLVGVVGLLFVAPGLVGQSPGAPWSQPWFQRVSMVDEEVAAGELPEHAQMLRGDERERVAGYYRDGARARLTVYHAGRALRQAPVEWILALLATALLAPGVWRRRPGALAPLAGLVPVLPALLIWSGPRHVAVALPVALAVVAASVSRLGPRTRWALALPVLGLWGIAQLAWPGVAPDVRAQAATLRDLEEVGTDLCQLATPGDLAGDDLRAFLYCPLPMAPLGDPTSDWRIWWVSRDPEPREGWVTVPTRNPRFVVQRYRGEITGSARPCADSHPPPGTPHIALQPRPVQLQPPCEPDPGWLAGLPPAPDSVSYGLVPDEQRDREREDRERRDRARPRSRFTP